ncbi:MAG: amidohydrolase family protein [Bacteroidales bacterium]|nr:amidohydrolase family protein [Bacteroidales bacterium]
MRKFSAQYIFTNTGRPLKRGVVTIDGDGTVTGVEDTNGLPTEKSSIEFYNGVIVPGFVNCHCHLELSHLKGKTDAGKGLGHFIGQVMKHKESPDDIKKAAEADVSMFREGISLCADVCNSDATFAIKQNSQVKYINLIETFGLDVGNAQNRIDRVIRVAETSARLGIPYNFVPHAVYSTSLPLFRLLKELGSANCATSIHFMEARDETELLVTNSGAIASTYNSVGIMPLAPELVKNHTDTVLNEITASGNLILVHNTFISRHILKQVQRPNLYMCLCPASNMYIEQHLPPVYMLTEETCNIIIGTDSLASNHKLSIMEELKILQCHFPAIAFEELVKWATINGATALGEENLFGTIEPGKKPGLVLIDGMDMENMKLKPTSFALRLI